MSDAAHTFNGEPLASVVIGGRRYYVWSTQDAGNGSWRRLGLKEEDEEVSTSKQDRRAYMRAYMRERRRRQLLHMESPTVSEQRISP